MVQRSVNILLSVCTAPYHIISPVGVQLQHTEIIVSNSKNGWIRTLESVSKWGENLLIIQPIHDVDGRRLKKIFFSWNWFLVIHKMQVSGLQTLWKSKNTCSQNKMNTCGFLQYVEVLWTKMVILCKNSILVWFIMWKEACVPDYCENTLRIVCRGCGLKVMML